MFNLGLNKNTILINGKFYAQNVTGVQRFAREILLEMDSQLQHQIYQNDFVILVPKDAINLPNLKNIKLIKTSLQASYLWEQLYLPIVSMGHKLLNLAGSAPLLKHDQYITMHDAAVFEANSAYSKVFTIWYQLLFTIQARFANKVFTVSKFSAERLSKILPSLQKKIFVIYNGYEHILRIHSRDDYLGELNLKNKNYYFSLGSFNPNKNINIILDVAKSFENNDILFVISGGVYARSFSRNPDVGPLPSNVRFIGDVGDEELKTLYLNAKSFIFPSKYEGFGIPIIEALALGVNVIASDIPATREVGGGLVSYFDPENSIQLQQLITNDNGCRKPEKMEELLSKFSWKKSTELLLTILTKEL